MVRLLTDHSLESSGGRSKGCKLEISSCDFQVGGAPICMRWASALPSCVGWLLRRNEIEIVDTSKVVQKKDVEVSMAALFANGR